MSDVVIRSRGLGKKFTISHQSKDGDLFADLMMSGARSLWQKTGAVMRGQLVRSRQVLEEFWALREVDFEIKRGELVSFIGHNGAGKTTLLKILSRITEPTEGRVEIDGRVNSLLEVGTGFHPELTGRENVFLNGAILGMSRSEMVRRFDEIVAFAGVEKFIDMPVKRYSTGMYVRLAFAVAAHLEAEILVVDEVLAVGDAEFQARCLNRMSEVANSGRTVLFVSHNFAAVTALTRRAIVLNAGRVTFDGPVEPALVHYMSSLSKGEARRHWGRGKSASLVSAELLDVQGMPTDRYVPGTPLCMRIVVDTTGVPGLSLDAILRDRHNIAVAGYMSHNFNHVALPPVAGRYECQLSLDSFYLAEGDYAVDLLIAFTNIMTDHEVAGAIRFVVDSCSPGGFAYSFSQERASGNIAMRLSAPLRFTPVAGPPAA